MKRIALARIERIILLLTLLALGLGSKFLYLPLIVLSILFSHKKFFNGSLSRNYLILTSFYMIILIFLVVAGIYSDSGEGVVYGVKGIFVVVYLGAIFQSVSLEMQNKMLIAYLTGIVMLSVYIFYYSLFRYPYLTGYGSVYNPLSGDIMNSPGLSNIFCVGVILALFASSDKNGILVRVLKSLYIVSLIWGGVILAGRAFFVITGFIFVYYFYRRRVLSYLHVAVFFVVMYLLFSFGLDVYDEKFLLIFDRFSDNGLESPRWALLAQGVDDLWSYPFGGMSPDVSRTGYGGTWFHNIFLDLGRISGVLPVLMLIFFVSFVFMYVWRFRDDVLREFAVITFLVSLIIGMQDVVFGSTGWHFIAMYFSGLIVSSQHVIELDSRFQFRTGNGSVFRKLFK